MQENITQEAARAFGGKQEEGEGGGDRGHGLLGENAQHTQRRRARQHAGSQGSAGRGQNARGEHRGSHGGCIHVNVQRRVVGSGARQRHRRAGQKAVHAAQAGALACAHVDPEQRREVEQGAQGAPGHQSRHRILQHGQARQQDVADGRVRRADDGPECVLARVHAVSVRQREGAGQPGLVPHPLRPAHDAVQQIRREDQEQEGKRVAEHAIQARDGARRRRCRFRFRWCQRHSLGRALLDGSLSAGWSILALISIARL